MKINAFDLIIIESLNEVSRPIFFEKTRIEQNCDVGDFISGLENSFAGLNKLFNSKDFSEYRENLSFFPSYFEVDTNTIKLTYRPYPFGEPILLTATFMINLRKDIEKYFQSIKEEQESKNEDPEDNEKKILRYRKLLKELKPFLKVSKVDDFIGIIEDRRSIKKGYWIGHKADAIRFMLFYHLYFEEMNNCFNFENDTKLTTGAANGISTSPTTGINEVLYKFR